MPKYPDIEIQLTGEDGNAFAVLGIVLKIARKHGLSDAEITKFQKEATSGDYNHLLATCMKWFEVK